MNPKASRLVLVVVLLAAGFWAWRIVFPGPEKVTRASLQDLAQTASFDNEGALAKAYNAQKIASFFSTNVEVNLDIHGYVSQTFNGRDELQQAALFARQHFRAIKIEFVDVNVTLGPDRESAVANLTVKATFSGEPDLTAQEFNFDLKKSGGRWLIGRVETVKTVSN